MNHTCSVHAAYIRNINKEQLQMDCQLQVCISLSEAGTQRRWFVLNRHHRIHNTGC